MFWQQYGCGDTARIDLKYHHSMISTVLSGRDAFVIDCVGVSHTRLSMAESDVHTLGPL